MAKNSDPKNNHPTRKHAPALPDDFVTVDLKSRTIVHYQPPAPHKGSGKASTKAEAPAHTSHSQHTEGHGRSGHKQSEH
jgi:hypothetical protein